MGIKNLMKIIKKYAYQSIKTTKITDYQNKILGIDSNLMIYKVIFAIRKNGYDLKNDEIIVTHIHAILQKLVAFIKYNIIPIFVFDSMYPAIKEQTMKVRKKFREFLEQKYNKSITK